MAVETLLLASVGTTDQWTLQAGANKVAACQAPDDESSSYIRSSTTSERVQQFNLVDPADIIEGATINYVRLRIRHMRGGTPAGNIQGQLRLGASVSQGTLISTGASWADQVDDFATKPGGGAWTITDLNNLIVEVTNGQTREVYCTTIEVIVDYTPAVSGVDGAGSATFADMSAQAAGEVVTPEPVIEYLRKWHEIPLLEDMSSPTKILEAGEYGVDWDGQIESIIGEVVLNGTHFLYYMGSKEYDATEGTPTWRSIGVATSSDGVHWTKYGSNPVITHFPTPHLEEGAVSGAMLVVDDTLHFWYGANTWTGGSDVDMAIRYCKSTDGFTFTDDTLILGGSGHERMPSGAHYDGSEWSVFYTHIDGTGGGAGGRGPIRRVYGSAPDNLTNDELILSDHYTKCPVVKISDDLLIMAAFRNLDRLMDVYWIDPANPSTLNGPIRDWKLGDPAIALVPYYEAESRNWRIYEQQWQVNGEIWLRAAKMPDIANYTPILDDFNRADGSLGLDWTVVQGDGFEIVNQTIRNPATSRFVNYPVEKYVGKSYTRPNWEFWIELPLWAMSSTSFDGMDVRGIDSSNNGYQVVWRGSDGTGVNLWRIRRLDAGTSTTLGDVVYDTPLASGDGVGIRRIGNTIQAWHRIGQYGVWYLVLERTDSTYTSGTINGALYGAGEWDASNTDPRLYYNLDNFGGGELPVFGEASTTFDSMTGEATGSAQAAAITGQGDVGLENMTAQAAGDVAISGQGAINLAGMAVEAAGQVDIQGVASQSFTNMSVVAAGAVAIEVQADSTFAAMTGAASGSIGSAPAEGQGQATFANMDGQAVGAVAIGGTGATVFTNMSGTTSGQAAIAGQGSAIFDVMTGAGQGSIGHVPITGSGQASLSGMSGQASGESTISGQAAVSFAGMTSTGGGAVSITGAGSASLAAMTGEGEGAVGHVPITGQGNITYGSMIGVAAGDVSITGTGVGVLSGQTAVAAGSVTVAGQGDIAYAAMTGEAAGEVETTSITGQGLANFASMAGEASGAVSITGQRAGSMSGLVAVSVGAVSITGQGDVLLDGIMGSAIGIVREPEYVFPQPVGRIIEVKDIQRQEEIGNGVHRVVKVKR